MGLRGVYQGMVMKFYRDFAFVASLGLFLASCTAAPSNAVNAGRIVNYTACRLPADQGRNSLYGNWTSLPVPVVLDRDFYVTDDGEAAPSLRGSMLTWNTWAGVRGTQAFSLLDDGVGGTAGRDIPALTDCAQGSYSSSVTDVVGIWKISTYGDHKNRRESCGTNPDGNPGKILAEGVQGQTDWVLRDGKIIGASILLNFDDFNAPGKRRIDVESLLLHELGHVLGLLHSCNGSTSNGTDSTSAPPCFISSGGQNLLVAPKQYADAVMFPFLEVDKDRRNLQQNDYDRVNCLY